MNIQTTLWEKDVLHSDIVYTPINVSKRIIDELNPNRFRFYDFSGR